MKEYYTDSYVKEEGSLEIIRTARIMGLPYGEVQGGKIPTVILLNYGNGIPPVGVEILVN
jgi:hypothetical protein